VSRTATYPIVNTDPARKETPEAARKTLGAVLFAGPSDPVAAEATWIALVRAVGLHNQRALQTLYDGAHGIVYMLSFRITGNRETAEEVTLDVFHEVWRRASAYDAAGGTVVGWIMNMTRSRAIDRLRHEQRKKRVAGQTSAPPAAAAEPEPSDRMTDMEQGRLLREAVAQLSAVERQAIEIAYFSELSYSETAARLGQPLGTIKTRIRAGLEKLRRLLRDAEGAS